MQGNKLEKIAKRMTTNKHNTYIPKILLVLGLSLVVLFVLGIVCIICLSHYQSRHPIYSARLENIEFCDDIWRELYQETIDELNIHNWQCFIYEGHTNRPVYVVVLLGKSDKITELPLSVDKETISSHPRIYTALKLSGENPQTSEKLGCVEYFYLPGAYVYRQCLILTEVRGTPKYLHDEQIQAFLEEIIRTKGDCQ